MEPTTRMKLLNEYQGAKTPEVEKGARAYLNEDGVACTDFYLGGVHCATHRFPDHTLAYAERAGENYKVGVLKL